MFQEKCNARQNQEMCYGNVERGTDSGDVKKTPTKYDNRLDMSEMEELGNGIKFDGKPTPHFMTQETEIMKLSFSKK